jgi:LAS superfamily LD-carboxypeptidase LdcB
VVGEASRVICARRSSMGQLSLSIVTIPPATRRLLVLALGLALVLATAPSAGAANGDPAAHRRQVQQQRAQAAAKVNVLKASDAEIERALDTINANVRAQEAAMASAQQAADQASAQAIAARAEEQRTAAELRRLQGAMRQVAVDAYVRGPAGNGAMLKGSTLSDVVLRQRLLDTALGHSTDVADQLRATAQDLALKRRLAEEAVARALERRKAVAARLGEVSAARMAKQRLADSVESRLEQALAEADSLAAVDRQLAAQIASRQASIARRIGPTSNRGGGGSRPTGTPSLTTVRGITVATSIAGKLESMLSAADGAGLSLSGTGYRSSEGQVAARRANCGTSDYDIYDKPASQCHPPTARPGQSMHEQGLAIDFTNNGALIQSHSNPAWQWLNSNASRYGFYNLPSEAWHWSTNGN